MKFSKKQREVISQMAQNAFDSIEEDLFNTVNSEYYSFKELLDNEEIDGINLIGGEVIKLIIKRYQ